MGFFEHYKQLAIKTALNAAYYTAAAAFYSTERFEILKSLKERQYSIQTKQLREQLLTSITSSTFLSKQLSPYFKTVSAEGLPFVNFAEEPEQVSQLKKIINGLYLTEKILAAIEAYPFKVSGRDTPEAFKALLNEIVPMVYQASDILTRADINLSEHFSVELNQIASFITLFRELAKPKATHWIESVSWTKAEAMAYTTGFTAGIAVDQLRPGTGEVDTRFLTTFSGELPKHLAALTSKIRGFTKPSKDIKPTISEKELNKLSLCADEIYWTLSKLQTGGSLEAINMPAYLAIGGHISTLSKSILQQIRHVNKASEEVIIHQLSELKTRHLLDLFNLVDKVEFQAALRPGTLSTPLMNYLNYWYTLLADYGSLVVDLNTVRPDLLIIEDSRFRHARMDNMLKRVAVFSTRHLCSNNIQTALNGFYETLGRIECNTRLNALPTEAKRGLLRDYAFIRPFMLYHNVDFDMRLLRDLDANNSESITDKELLPIQTCLETREDIESSLKKTDYSIDLYKRLGLDLSQAFFSSPKAKVLPYSIDWQNPFPINEATLLNKTPTVPLEPIWKKIDHHIVVSDPSACQNQEAQLLYESYQALLHRFTLLETACISLKERFTPDQRLVHTQTLRQLYWMLQPYLMHCPTRIETLDTIEKRLVLDRDMISCLDEETPENQVDVTTFNRMQQLLSDTLISLTNHKTWAGCRCESFAQSTKSFLAQQVIHKGVEFDKTSLIRMHHIFKTENYSKQVAELKKAVTDSLTIFNEPIREQLATANTSGKPPFPEIEDEGLLLKTADQVSWIKRLINCVYYVEFFFKEMELLNTNDYKFSYLMHTIYAYWNAKNAIDLFESLRHDLHLSILFNDALQKLGQMQGTLLGIKPLYLAPSTAIKPPEGTHTYAGIWYPLQTFMVLPEHLKALHLGRDFTAQEAQQHQVIAKRTTLEIEKIINHSDSYFRLFLVSPEIIRVFNRLRKQLTQFSGTTYASVMEHLQSIRYNYFPTLLSELDEWENRMGLKVGLLSHPIRNILDQFYLGLIESLNLPSKDHLELATSIEPFNQRQLAIIRFSLKAERESTRLAKHIATLEMLKDSINTVGSKSWDEIKPTFKQQLKAAMPLLLELKNRFSLGLSKVGQDKQIDERCKELMPNEMAHLNHIKFLTNQCLNAYIGKKNSQELSQKIAAQQLFAVKTEAAVQQNQVNKDYTTQYATRLLNQHIETLIKAQTDVINLKPIYNQALRRALLENEAALVDELIKQNQTTPMQHQMVTLLKEPFNRFVKEYYSDYMQLESIAVGLAEFKAYCQRENFNLTTGKSLLFESKKTLGNKIDLIERMQRLMMDDKIPVKKRLELLRHQANDYNFKKQLCDFEQYDRLSWQGLKQAVARLLQYFHLYTSENKRQFDQLIKTSRTPVPSPHGLINRYNLFHQARTYNLPIMRTTQELPADHITSIN